ncbi:G patch domain and ankyrin repeat-containing protein 1 homolog [Condylostylus longicornis]|uniref:G patch domain and ankyrin repeat-containing protein 1 homolog n=1 Tax=Condylostylus longicornis TaxID=2530218 RepID=UPI00244E174F|nr:G patch domain and ankyrin repeat-containing protein 1 homolog [Condylostylus longicornis]
MNCSDPKYIEKCQYWNAVTNTCFPFKRFLRSSELSESLNNLPSEAKVEIPSKLSGSEIKEFYENVVKNPVSNKNSKDRLLKEEASHEVGEKNGSVAKIEFDKTRFFRAATYNDLKTLRSFIYKDDSINSTDQYGWSALMMASCENSIDAVKFLLFQGANKYICDGKGNTALDLSKRKGYSTIVNLLTTYKNKDNNQLKKELKNSKYSKTFKYFCSICNENFNVRSKKEHETSTIHLFNTKNDKKSFLRYSTIPNNNRGLKMMVKQGWDRESGLGPKRNGNLFPIKTVIRKPRSGLGIEQDSAKITHFKPYDLNAIKYKPMLKSKSRNDIKRERKRNKKMERRLRNELS